MPLPRHPWITYYDVSDTDYRQIDQLMSTIKRRMSSPEGSWIDPAELIKALRVFAAAPPRVGEGPKVVVASLPPLDHHKVEGPFTVMETRRQDGRQPGI